APHGRTVVRPGDYVFVMLDPKLRWLADHVFAREGRAVLEASLPGDLTLGALRESHGVTLPGGDPDERLGSYLGARLARPPRVGDRLSFGLISAVVLDIDRNHCITEIGLELASDA